MHKYPKIEPGALTDILKRVPFTYVVEIISIDTYSRQAERNVEHNTKHAIGFARTLGSGTEVNHRPKLSRVIAPLSRPLVARGKKEIANRKSQPSTPRQLHNNQHHAKSTIADKSSSSYVQTRPQSQQVNPFHNAVSNHDLI